MRRTKSKNKKSNKKSLKQKISKYIEDNPYKSAIALGLGGTTALGSSSLLYKRIKEKEREKINKQLENRWSFALTVPEDPLGLKLRQANWVTKKTIGQIPWFNIKSLDENPNVQDVFVKYVNSMKAKAYHDLLVGMYSIFSSQRIISSIPEEEIPQLSKSEYITSIASEIISNPLGRTNTFNSNKINPEHTLSSRYLYAVKDLGKLIEYADIEVKSITSIYDKALNALTKEERDIFENYKKDF